MAPDVSGLKKRAEEELKGVGNLKDLDEVFRKYLGRKGELTLVLRSLVQLPVEQRSLVSKEANAARDELRQLTEELRKALEGSVRQGGLDVTAPGVRIVRGHLHPLTRLQREVNGIFSGMGFSVVEGPEIEDEWHNFDALNIPANHPSRDMWDTFWMKEKLTKNRHLLRTHTSPVQIRYMEHHEPPLRVIVPGRVFRYEATDARHGFNFYQLEGLMVGKQVSVANFKGVIMEFYKRLFRSEVKVRLRPSYFPFTEPSFEVDMSCLLCGQKGCGSCGQSGWLEMMGAGMVHPKVFEAVGYNPKFLQGFAFGMGLDRLAMMRYKINDARLLYSGSLKFLEQF
ncbi:MAG: phenylalanine--tRNA ligase subunit alpha [bacterium]|nr:phenylalanine--tRNA ligase subunit alpha [bacterium]MDZ4231939.1 phenylalanine--tRNA ligase subunit alpha [Candidatus Pacearchaeota archaeon]